MSITMRSVQALKPGEVIWDNRVPGFGARRQQNAVAYILKFRLHGVQRFVTLGRHGVLTPDEARRKAKRMLGSAAGGSDPATPKGDAIGAVANEYLAWAEKNQRPSSYGDTERYLRQ